MATVAGWGVDQIYASKAGTANNKTTLCQFIKMPMIWLTALPTLTTMTTVLHNAIPYSHNMVRFKV